MSETLIYKLTCVWSETSRSTAGQKEKCHQEVWNLWGFKFGVKQEMLFGQRERRQEGREAGQVVHQEKADGRTLICLTLCACKLFLKGDYFV